MRNAPLSSYQSKNGPVTVFSRPVKMRLDFSSKGAITVPLVGLFVALLLAACGDNSAATVAPTNLPATTIATTTSTAAVVPPTVSVSTTPLTTAALSTAIPATATALPPTATI